MRVHTNIKPRMENLDELIAALTLAHSKFGCDDHILANILFVEIWPCSTFLYVYSVGKHHYVITTEPEVHLLLLSQGLRAHVLNPELNSMFHLFRYKTVYSRARSALYVPKYHFDIIFKRENNALNYGSIEHMHANRWRRTMLYASTPFVCDLCGSK